LVSDSNQLAAIYPAHGGIVLANQRQLSLSALVAALDRLLSETDAADWPGRLRSLGEADTVN
jgi:hypothetical protein